MYLYRPISNKFQFNEGLIKLSNYYMVNSYPAHTKSDNPALFISCSSGYHTVRWAVPTFLSTSRMLQSPSPHHTADRTLYHCYKVSYWHIKCTTNCTVCP